MKSTAQMKHARKEILARLTLWRACFPDASPLRADVNFTPLSGLEFSCSVIKSAALQAADFAAAEGGPISMSQIDRASGWSCASWEKSNRCSFRSFCGKRAVFDRGHYKAGICPASRVRNTAENRFQRI